ncbi:DNA helicase MCM9 isoform X2 [Corythoichthys intestinalis]|uniref:DNA helicase MCM9 isoform X2 n=1 Tax=Corythoichthys intestinalis TaxID=161448 RepID=UPI0025A5C50D|nr:DNA helicase MCM9 isoform X2 [Corythoichthys intestinalis]
MLFELFKTKIGDYFNAYPSDVLTIFDKVLQKTARELSKNATVKHLDGLRPTEQRVKNTLHARITGLPVCPELTRDTIPRSRDVGHFLSVTGTVIRTSIAKVLEYGRDYMCAKCRHIFMLQADFEQFYSFVPPVVCPNPDGCNSCKFSCLSGGSEPAACRDYQEIKIQEQVQRLSIGSIPRSMVVVLEDDLVDTCKSGDDVTVYGVMCQRWKPFYDGSRCDVELVLKANNIEVNNQQGAASLLTEDVQKEFEEFWEHYKYDPIAGRNQILLSLCPQVYGMYVIKLAVAMVLAGGVQRIDSSGTRTRGECHMLLVGDPGTGKSQFLKYAAKMMPRSVLTAGIGSTSAGLTVAAVKDGGDWHLEAGALVLSDGGLCCIDEFNSIKEHDRISIHEAMEQQSISVAKAGMVCKLNTRTTILAATNPKGQYDPNESLSVNIALGSPLLSRFDLVLVLLDNRNTDWDRIISSFILEERGLPSESATLWPMEKMKAYFCVIKRLQPQVSAEANSILSRYYQLQRRSEGRNAARTTIRMLESLGRLAEAHARLMYRETVTIEDAVMAVSVMECSMQGGGLLGSVNAVLTSFPDEPGQQYQTQCQVLLEGLNLPVLLQKEMDRLARLGGSRTEASSFGQPSDHQHQMQSDIPEAQKSIAEPDDGLHWFDSITPSRASQEITSPVSTSTQQDNEKPHSDLSTNITSRVNHNLDLNTDQSVTEKRGMVRKKHQKVQENQNGIDGQHAQPLGSVTQKVSKNLAGRVKEQHSKIQPGEKAGIGESVVSLNNTNDPVTISNQTDNSGLDKRIQGSQGCRTSTTTINKTITEENMPVKFSNFTFKPKKMRPLVHHDNDSNVSTITSQRPIEPKVGSKDNKDLPENDDGKNKQDKKHQSLKSGGVRKPVSCVSKKPPLRFTSETSDKKKPTQAQSGGNKSPNHGRGSTDGSKEGFTLVKPPSSSLKSTVVPSTLAKLSRFSFTGTTEPRPKSTNHQKETSPQEIDHAEISSSDLVKQPQNSVAHSQKLEKIPEVNVSLRLNSEAQDPERNARIMPKYSIKLTEPTQAGLYGVKLVEENVGKLKRKSFDLDPPIIAPHGSKGMFINTPLFGSGDLNDDILDTDWDKEVVKKAKL